MFVYYITFLFLNILQFIESSLIKQPNNDVGRNQSLHYFYYFYNTRGENNTFKCYLQVLCYFNTYMHICIFFVIVKFSRCCLYVLFTSLYHNIVHDRSLEIVVKDKIENIY